MILKQSWTRLEVQVGGARRARGKIAIAHAFLGVCVSLACRNEPRPRPSEVPPPPPAQPSAPTVLQVPVADLMSTHLLCMRADSVRLGSSVVQFGEVVSDTTTGDVAALVFRLSIADSGVTGEFSEAAGAFGPMEPLTDLSLDLRRETISFAYGDGENRSQFAGRISCDSIWGRWVLGPTQVVEGKAFRRMK